MADQNERAKCESAGVSAEDCDKCAAAGLNFGVILQLLKQYGPQILTLIMALLGKGPLPTPLPTLTAKS